SECSLPRRQPRFAHSSCALPPILAAVKTGRAAGLARYRQQYTDLGAAVLAVGGADLPAVLLHQLLDYREPETCSLHLARHVRIERLVDDVLADPGAVVRHLDLDRLRVAPPDVARRDIDPRIRLPFHRLERIAHQIVEDLPHA